VGRFSRRNLYKSYNLHTTTGAAKTDVASMLGLQEHCSVRSPGTAVSLSCRLLWGHSDHIRPSSLVICPPPAARHNVGGAYHCRVEAPSIPGWPEPRVAWDLLRASRRRIEDGNLRRVETQDQKRVLMHRKVFGRIGAHRGCPLQHHLFQVFSERVAGR
jgi:hypothetical protein